MKTYRFLTPLFIVIAAFATACGGGDDGGKDEPEPPGPQIIEVTSITLSHTSLNLVPDATQQLSATIAPANATNKTIKWESTDKSVATISSSGLVKAIADGTTTIIATAGNKSATCEVKVESVPVVTVTGETATVDLSLGASVAQLQDEINEADEQGVTEYKLVGEAKNLGITSAKGAKNVFANTNAEVIDMSQVTGWPTITKSALYNSNHSADAAYMTEELPGVPAEYFYKKNSTIKEIILPAEVQAIGEKAFCEVSSLEKLDAPGLKIVGSQGLQATGLKEINLPNATTLGRAWASYCRNLTKVTLASATYVGYNGIAVCPLLKSVSIPNLTTLEGFTFTDCTSLTEVNLPSVTTLNDGDFCECTALTTINMPLVKTVGNTTGNYVGPFYKCTALTNVSLPKAKTIGKLAFEGCTALQQITLPVATTIYVKAFYGCSSLTNVSLPEVTNVKDSAFEQCKALKTLSLPKTVEIGANALGNTPRLQSLILTASGNIEFADQGYTFDSSMIDLTLNSNKQSEVKYGYQWKGMDWLSINFQ